MKGITMQSRDTDRLKDQANAAKHELISILNELEEINPKEAEVLSEAIAAIEGWQNM